MSTSQLVPWSVDGADLHLLVWRFDDPMLVASTAPAGGGFGLRRWIINAQVPPGYARRDPERHVHELADALGLRGEGVGMLTAVDVAHSVRAEDAGASVEATVGVTHPTWAAAHGDGSAPELPGTINVVGFVPRSLTPAALLNTLCTVTEAKCQALMLGGIAGTGTPTDAVTVVCGAGGPVEPFGGPRSLWGSRLARAAYEAICSVVAPATAKGLAG